MLKVTSGMLANSQGTLMKFLEISKKKLLAACLDSYVTLNTQKKGIRKKKEGIRCEYISFQKI